MTEGILDPRHYYCRRGFTDAVRAIDAARSHPDVDASQITVTGGSPGGGITPISEPSATPTEIPPTPGETPLPITVAAPQATPLPSPLPPIPCPPDRCTYPGSLFLTRPIAPPGNDSLDVT